MRRRSLTAAVPAAHPSSDIELSPDAVAFICFSQALTRHCSTENINGSEAEYAKWLRKGDAISDRASAAAKQVLRQRPGTIGDIVARACIVAHYFGHDLMAVGDDDSCADMCRWSSENLALAILKSELWPTARLLRSALQSGGRHG
jgi:hypothetical protein